MKGNAILYGDIKFNEVNEVDPDKYFTEYLSSSQVELINDILTELSKWTGLELENATHNEDPWIIAHRGYGAADRCENVITKDSMRIFYGNELNG